MNLQSHFDNIHKIVASKIKLLGRIQIDSTPAAAEMNYKVMILPIFCCGYVVVVVDCRVQINGGRIVDVLRTMVGMVSILEC